METRKIGSLAVSVVGLGCNNFGGRLGGAATEAVVDAALDSGITFFDTADIYGNARSEELLGTAIGSRRDEIVLATKFGVPYDGHQGGASPPYIRQAVADSLRRLKTDRIDLYQLHIPDRATPIADTLGTLDDLVREGKVREVGCSNFSAAQLREAAAAAADGAARFVCVQNQYSVLDRGPEEEVLPECEREALSFLPFFPLANGLLTGKYRPGKPAPEGTRLAGMPSERSSRMLTDERLATVKRLDDLAHQDGRTVLDVAFAWLLSRPRVASVIAGATTPEQVRRNVATQPWVLPQGTAERIDAIAPAG